ncbi:hypothetical protein [Streptomyces sp. ISID311]|uniref:hypothetical protein n=1 Tax=Streptomyces sp. ISID311 TaxID=2601673 RepID=UPI0011BD37FA|nr:hypothetical protein [Streptomyces sp. ISID311]TXC99748.1 hypothetical protein FS847_00195 [Streptomyces sp. ISID311]
MNNDDWTGELAALREEERLCERLRSEVGTPSDATVDRAVAMVLTTLRPHCPEPAPAPDDSHAPGHLPGGSGAAEL